MRKNWNWLTSIRHYLRSLGAAGRAPRTINLHRHYLHQIRTCAPTPASVTREHLETLLAARDWAPETRRSARTVCRGFFGWCVSRRIIEDSPAADLPAIRVPAAIPRPASESSMAEALGDADTRLDLMIRLAGHCGLRCVEVATVHRSNWDGAGLYVRGKGGSVRWVPVEDRILAAALNSCDGWLFPGRIDGHLSPQYVSRLMSRDLPDDVTAHRLRHRFATVAWDRTRDLLSVSVALGHVQLETTRRYIRHPTDALRACVAAASPA